MPPVACAGDKTDVLPREDGLPTDLVLIAGDKSICNAKIATGELTMLIGGA